jgi:hypothetical protein
MIIFSLFDCFPMQNFEKVLKNNIFIKLSKSNRLIPDS